MSSEVRQGKMPPRHIEVRGAVVVWGTLMWSLMKDIVRTMGVRTDVPFRDLSPREKEIVYHGELKKHHVHYVNPRTLEPSEMDFNYYSAVNSVKNSLAKVKDEKGMKRLEKYLKEGVCPDCHGTRLSEAARAPRLRGIGLDRATAMTLSELIPWVQGVPASLPKEMRPMAQSICESFMDVSERLMDLGLGYLSLDRAASTLSTGERQRVQLARAVRNRTTGVLYVLDEPSIGLHPHNLKGLTGVMDDLRADGNSVIIVDHDTRVLKHADWMIEMGQGAGADGGKVIAEGRIANIAKNPRSVIGPYLSDRYEARIRPVTQADRMFDKGAIHLETGRIHTVHPLDVRIPMGRLTVATYANVHDELRKAYAKTQDVKERSLKAGDFSYNTGRLRCPACDGTGEISLDVQFLPDVKIPCPDCRGSRYGADAFDIRRKAKDGNAYSLPELMNMSVDQALNALDGLKLPRQRLQVLHDLGLGYLTLGEETPGLSGGEAQRLKLASEMGKGQSDSVFVFDEPTIGLHPQDVRTLLLVFQTLIDHGATVVVIEHDLDVVDNADYSIDMGPGGGKEGGRVVACGTPDEIRHTDESITGRYI